MYEFKDVEIENAMNEAILYLSLNIKKSSHNKKPVITHSIMVGTTLYNCGYSLEIVVAGILHDLIEDTDVTYKDICDKFGKNIADNVLAVSFDNSIVNLEDQTRELFNRIDKFDYDAMIIKCADLYCNLPFYNFVYDQKTINYLIDKYNLFIIMFDKYLKDELLYQEYKKRCKNILG